MESSKKNKQFNIVHLVISCTIGVLIIISLLWIVNGSVLYYYYQQKTVVAMVSAYNEINSAVKDDRLDSDEFNLSFLNISEKDNMNILVVDPETETLKATAHDLDKLSRVLFGYLFEHTNFSKDVVIVSNKNYEIHHIVENISSKEYLDMWGLLDGGDVFIIRCSVESIKHSADIAGDFCTYLIVFIVVLILGMIIVYSRRRIILDLRMTNERLQHDIEQKEQLEQMRSEFLSNVSHELKTPLALINGYAEGLIECADDEDTREYYCDVIMDEAHKMNEMVKKLLDINHLEFGDVEYTKEAFDITEMIKGYLSSVKVLSTSKDANVIFESVGPLMVYSDQFYVEECLNNYYTNALNHLSGDKNIIIKAEKMEETDEIRVSVFNTGEKIPQEAVPHLFEKFYKVDKARTREYGGSGVGLSIVKAIMDSLNGTYGVENYDDGVLFYFTVKCDH